MLHSSHPSDVSIVSRHLCVRVFFCFKKLLFLFLEQRQRHLNSVALLFRAHIHTFTEGQHLDDDIATVWKSCKQKTQHTHTHEQKLDDIVFPMSIAIDCFLCHESIAVKLIHLYPLEQICVPSQHTHTSWKPWKRSNAVQSDPCRTMSKAANASAWTIKSRCDF